MDSPLTRYNDIDINATEKMRHDFAPTDTNRNFKFYLSFLVEIDFIGDLIFILSRMSMFFFFVWKLIEILIIFNDIGVYGFPGFLFILWWLFYIFVCLSK